MPKHNLRGYVSTRTVFLDEDMLIESESQAVVNHSPDGFCWGYGGSGPSQLALAVCLKLYPKKVALEIYQDFKFDLIARLPIDKDFDIMFCANKYAKEVKE